MEPTETPRTLERASFLEAHRAEYKQQVKWYLLCRVLATVICVVILLVYEEGSPTLFAAACNAAGVRPADGVVVPVDVGPVPADFRMGQPSAYGGRVAAAAVAAAARAAMDGRLDAVVTAPLSKV